MKIDKYTLALYIIKKKNRKNRNIKNKKKE